LPPERSPDSCFRYARRTARGSKQPHCQRGRWLGGGFELGENQTSGAGQRGGGFPAPLGCDLQRARSASSIARSSRRTTVVVYSVELALLYKRCMMTKSIVPLHVIAIAVFLQFIAGLSLGEVSRTIDTRGTVHLSNVPQEKHSRGAGKISDTISSPGSAASTGTEPDGPPPWCRSPAAGVLTRYPVVEIFSKPTCPWTARAREFFERNRIPYRYFDITSDAEATARLKQWQRTVGKESTGIPVVVIGRTLIDGFRPNEYWHALCTER